MSMNDGNFASLRVWLDGRLHAAAMDRDNSRAVLLAKFLVSDVQASEYGARLYIGWLDAVLGGERESESGIGNGYSVIVDRKSVCIAHEYLEELPSYRYTHNEFRVALGQALTVILEAKRKKLLSGSVSSSDE